MGTPDFAVPALEAIINSGHNVAAVFTQPDRPKNRGQKLCCSPVKACAAEHNIDVYQPQSLRKGEDAQTSLDIISKINPDCIVVAAYGQILPKAILDLPKYGCINIHASLLPKYRGASPIQACIAAGEKESGVTIMHMSEGLDTGDMIISGSTPILPEMNGSELHDKLSEIGAKLVITALEQLENGTAKRIVQDDSLSCYAPLIKKEQLLIDFSMPAQKVHDFIRAMAEYPGAYSFLCGKRLKAYSSVIVEENFNYKSGTLVDLADFTVVCGDGKAVSLTDVKLEGCRQMAAAECARGRNIPLYTVLGE